MEVRLRAHVTPLYKGKCALRLISGSYMEESLFSIFVSLAKAIQFLIKLPKYQFWILKVQSAMYGILLIRSGFRTDLKFFNECFSSLVLLSPRHLCLIELKSNRIEHNAFSVQSLIFIRKGRQVNNYVSNVTLFRLAQQIPGPTGLWLNHWEQGE